MKLNEQLIELLTKYKVNITKVEGQFYSLFIEADFMQITLSFKTEIERESAYKILEEE